MKKHIITMGIAVLSTTMFYSCTKESTPAAAAAPLNATEQQIQGHWYLKSIEGAPVQSFQQLDFLDLHAAALSGKHKKGNVSGWMFQDNSMSRSIYWYYDPATNQVVTTGGSYNLSVVSAHSMRLSKAGYSYSFSR